ncbi:tRNA dihydrouridine(20/20a) synthase DusA [Tropicimonas sp. IMCC6043]|uniref:tRNA dihydrouridine(20/20a) synthase DusA n=1 Tax=Tropicimonas sp. IMCC6043 TaxID=2510645 RepID=UPI00101C798E|nr:tRNA dihydrouridine(20/20a) synthase DusA [Tropicimonas sp. IMCC6043]RYH10649.1 tRNA dihydrouridine(20/20a) synthase DusA [Tropicimonas sp. IMCC6043]
MQGPTDPLSDAARLSVAPMIDWTDRHCRFFHRQMSARALLYSEMVTAPALVRGGARHLLDFDPAESPVALQLGGADPRELAEAARMAEDAGYDEVNLNLGCPSDRVQSGRFGAVLMQKPALVAECLSEMVAAVRLPVTAKCRIGVDVQDPEDVLPAFLEAVRAAGVQRVIIHARKAWLSGLSPKENRDIPPLDYPLVREMKRRFPEMHLSINGGVQTLEEAEAHLAAGMDGVMIGRAAYQRPADILLAADQRIFGETAPAITARDVAERMRPYIARHLEAGGSLHQVTRHMLGLFAGQTGARGWRRVLSEGAVRPGAGLEVLEAALERVPASGDGILEARSS